MGYDLRMRALALFVLPLLAAAVAAQTKDPGPVIGMNNWIHSTADLDKTVQFYIDVFGLDKPAPPRPRRPEVRTSSIVALGPSVNARSRPRSPP